MAHHQSRIPCPGEVRRLGPLAQFVGGLAAHADGFAGAGDGAHDGEGVDEVRLSARSPAIGAAAGGGGREGEDGFVFGGHAGGGWGVRGG
ncbi:hypothetical protein [Sphingomonas sp.]|uniref:hypothetical protein n=1 Tax=Sphingomonas sp. TaxID=28214 RepID=UPI003F724595